MIVAVHRVLVGTMWNDIANVRPWRSSHRQWRLTGVVLGWVGSCLMVAVFLTLWGILLVFMAILHPSLTW